MDVQLEELFYPGQYFPPNSHEERIERYNRNDKLVKGRHDEVFKESVERTDNYVSANFAGLITRKSADFLFGENTVVSSGRPNTSGEQEALDRLTNDNKMHRLNYQQALKASTFGDAFYKVRFGQEYGGAFPESYDPKRVLIESVDPRKVYPQTHPFDQSKIIVYHIAEPVKTNPDTDEWTLFVESHFAGKIIYRQFELSVFSMHRDGVIYRYKIGDELPEGYEEQLTGVPVPLVIHVANYNDGSTWEGLDDVSEHVSLFDELNNRISQVASILDKHADPAIAVPTGLLQEDGEGGTYFQVALNKVFEVMGKDDIIPQYITNANPQLDQAITELDKLLEYLLSATEIPAVAVGLQDSGTSGNSGLAIKWRMNALLAKINRKRQFFDDGLKRVYMIAEMLEQYAMPSEATYELVEPQIKFNDGLPTDDTEIANRMAVRTGGVQTLSRKTAIMVMDGLSEEQADAEIKRIEEEEKANNFADPSIFNEETQPAILQDNKMKNDQTDNNQDSKENDNKGEVK